MSLLAVLVGALIVPVGYALSTDSTTARSHAPVVAYKNPQTQTTAVSLAAAPIVAHAPALPAADFPTVPDAAKLLIVGTFLFGLAAAVRKAH